MKLLDGFLTLLMTLVIRLLDLWESQKADREIDEAKKRHAEIDRDPLGYGDRSGMFKPGESKGFSKTGPNVPDPEANRQADSTK